MGFDACSLFPAFEKGKQDWIDISREGMPLIPHRPTTAEINLDALAFNYRQVREKIS